MQKDREDMEVAQALKRKIKKEYMEERKEKSLVIFNLNIFV